MPYTPTSAFSLLNSVEPGPRLIDGSAVSELARLVIGCQSNMAISTNAADPTPLTQYINEVASGTQAILPKALPGTVMLVLSPTAVTVQARTNLATGVNDTINGAATFASTGIVMFISHRLGRWVTVSLAGTFTA